MGIIEKDASEHKLKKAGVLIFKTEKPIITEEFNFIVELGRILTECEYNLEGTGIITEQVN